MNPIHKELLALVIIIIFVILFYVSLIPMFFIACTVVVVLMSIVFLVSTFTRTDRDEREQAHRTIAAESGYVAAGIVVLVAIITGTLHGHQVDPWLFVILIVMLSARLITRYHLDNKK